jgi:hypothetical protein
LFDLLWAGEGRFDWDTIYNLPLPIRRFWVTKINKEREEQADRAQAALEKAQARNPRTKKP